MDYSSLPNDPDHPAGTSPWNSSPAPDRGTFAQSEANSEPSSPLAKHSPPNPETQQQEYNDPIDQEPPSPPLPEDHPEPKGAGRMSVRTASTTSPDVRFQGPPLTEEELRAKQIQQQRAQERYQQALHAQQHQRGSGPNRYHQGGRQGQRQPPQYRLQAKITTLERTGKRDPAIHFDVHVRSCLIGLVYRS